MRKGILTAAVLGASALGLAGCSGTSTTTVNVNTNSNRTMSNMNMSGNSNSMMNSNMNSSNMNSMMNSNSTSMKEGEDFMKKAAQGGMAEVELGKMVAGKAQSPEVKAFAQRMVTDHSKANDELKALAAKMNVMLPTTVNNEQKEMMDKLSKLSGAELDKEYVKGMVEDHEKDVAEFQKESESSANADVKAFAAKTLPTLKSHLDQIKTINGKMK
jgi:putative membrane protein